MQPKKPNNDLYYSELINGSHYNGNDEEYYEWWYFHFLSEDGFAANIVLHETDIFGLVKNPYISISLRLPDGEIKYGRIALDIDQRNIAHFSDKFNVLGGVRLCSIIEEENHIMMSLNFFNDISFETKIRKQYSSIVMNNGVLYSKPNLSGVSYWTVNIPRGECEVKLKVEGQEYKFKCFTYHDHQWGNFPIQNFVHDWVWGNFCNSKESIIFFIIVPTNGDIINRQVLISKEKIIITSGKPKHNPCYLINTSLNKNVQEIESETVMPQIVLDWDEDIYFSLNPSQILRSRIKEKHSGFTATYLRWGSYGIYSEDSNIQLFGITEYLRIRKGGENER